MRLAIPGPLRYLLLVHRNRFELHPGVFLDARRAVWFETERALAVADLHLGYAWAQRASGNLHPIEPPDDTVIRLIGLVQEYRPKELIILGDVVHSTASLEPVRQEILRLWDGIAAISALSLIAGNHDRGLLQMLADCQLGFPVTAHATVGRYLLCHGDRAEVANAGFSPDLTFIGHEHPAIQIGDGIASVKCPCFVAGPEMVIVPAFSSWAAGTNIRSGQFLSPLAQKEKFTRAFAIIAGKLLPIKL